MATSVNTSTQQYFGFDPRTIPGCVLWMDAADRDVMFSDTGRTTLATLGGTVLRWNDKSGFSNHVTASSGTTTLTASAINGVPALSFASSWFTGGFSSTYTGNQLRGFAVATLASGSGAYARIFSLGRPTVNDFNATDTTFLFIRNNGGQNLMVGRFNSYLGVNIPAYSTPFLVQAGHDSNIESIAVNGALTPATQNTGVSGNFNITSYGIGTNTNTADIQPFIGLVGEIIYYTENLTTAQIQQVEGYLAWKWGLPANLPVGHAFKYNPTTMRVFRPVDIDACALWLDAADLSTILPANITSGTAITEWRDKSVSATFAVPQRGASGTAPVFSNVGGVQSIFINNGGVNADYNASTYAQLQVQSNIQTTQDYSVFAVINLCNVSSAVNQTIYSNRRGGVERAPQLGPGSTFESISTGPFRLIATSFLGTGIRQTSLISTLASFVQLNNGAAYASVVSNLDNRFTTDADPLPTIGGTFSSVGQDSRFTTGHFHELILYNKALTTSERQQVEGYLAEKWRTPALPTTQPYFSQRSLPSIPIFSPTAVSGLQVWLDAADSSVFTLSGSNVTQWRDKSGNGRHFNPLNGTRTPFLHNGFNGRPTVESPAAPNIPTVLNSPSIASSNIQGATGFSFFMVSRVISGVVFVQYEFPRIISLEGSNRFDYGQPNVIYNYPAGFTNTSNNILNLNHTSSTSTIALSYNGSLLSNYSVNNVTSQYSGIIALFGTRDGNIPAFGQISEFIIYNRSLLLSERQQVEGYLAWKWGLETLLPTAPTFTPASVSPAIWLDAADASTFTLSGSNVAEWRDKSGNSRHYSQATDANRPTRANNNVSTSGDQFLINASPLAIGGYDVFVVGKPLSSTATWRTLLRGSVSEHPIMVETGSTRLGTYLNTALFQQFGQAGQNLLTLDGTQRALIYLNIPTSRVLNASLNGVIGTSTTANGSAALVGTNFYALGNIQGGGQAWGDMNEVIIIPNTTLAVRRQIEGYLAWKWSIALQSPVVHPFSKLRP